MKKPIFIERRYLRLLLSAFLSFIMTINVPALAAYTTAAQVSGVQDSKPPELGIWGPTVAMLTDDTFDQPFQPTASPLVAQSSQSLLLEGIDLYRAERFSDAVNTWTDALIASNSDDLTKALLFSNLSLAYQHLGKLDNASISISNSLDILRTLADTTHSGDYWETVGKALNTQGRLLWIQGAIEDALATWRNATAAYNQANHPPGIIRSLINQAKALQTIGFHLQAKTVLKQVATYLQNTELDAALQATSLWQLGNAQRQFGMLKDSQKYLKKSLDIVDNNSQLNHLKAAVYLELGNTERALWDRASAINRTNETNIHQVAALQAYQEAASFSLVSSTQFQAELNQLSFLIDLERWTEASNLWPQLLSKLDLPPSRSAIYGELNFAHSLTRLMQAQENEGNTLATDQPLVSPFRRGTDRGFSATSATSGKPLRLRHFPFLRGGEKAVFSVAQDSILTWQLIDEILENAVQQADSLNDPIARSYGLGQRGTLYEITGQWSQAEAFTQKALQLTTTHDYPNARYRWQWQQGRLLKKQNKQEQAITAYDAAVDTLEGIRSNLRFIDTDVQFSFRDNVEPIYREFAELLLIREDSQPPTDDLMEQAIQQIDSLQLSELENFLRCSLAQTTRITKLNTDPKAAILYPMILENHLTVILQLPDSKEFYKTEISKAEVETTLNDLRTYLSASRSGTPEVIPLAEQVYDWLVEPFEEILQQSEQIETLVFVLDGPLRNIPMGVLYDGEEFLIQKYAIAVAPELELFTPQPLSDDLQVFTGGVGEPQTIEGRSFEPIEKLEDELDVISDLFGPQPPLINQQFQGQTLQDQLSTGEFSGIHLKTHGVFSSDPEETFIVAYNELLKGDELGSLIQAGSAQGATPIELLVLSACSTATGDNRAVLGLAGITVRAGARSTVSTLWDAQDIPNTQLMIKFYEELKQPNTTRAQALRNAQLFLIERGYRAPHLWATYVLVGNWL